MLNCVTRSYAVATLQEKDDVGVISHELFDPRIVSPAEDVRELFMGLLNDRHRIFHGARTLELKRWALLGHDLGAVRYRMARIERVRMLVRRQVVLHLRRGGQIDVANEMR